MNNYTHSNDSLLDKIRLSCIQLTNRHIKNHLYYKGASAYFEIPTIILYGYNNINKHQTVYENNGEFNTRTRIINKI